MKYFVLSGGANPFGSYDTGKGLCLYIETSRHKILYGLGQTDALIKNAAQLGVDLRKVDVVVLPEARQRSCAGLTYFLKINQTATIYARPEVWLEYFQKSFGLVPCGIKRLETQCKARFQPVNAFYALDAEILFFDAVKVQRTPKNYVRAVDEYVDGEWVEREVPDDFSHELSLALVGREGVDLVTAGSHSGLENLVSKLSNSLVSPVVNVIGELLYVSNSGDTKRAGKDLSGVVSSSNFAFYLSTSSAKRIVKQCKSALKLYSGMTFETH